MHSSHSKIACGCNYWTLYYKCLKETASIVANISQQERALIIQRIFSVFGLSKSITENYSVAIIIHYIVNVFIDIFIIYNLSHIILFLSFFNLTATWLHYFYWKKIDLEISNNKVKYEFLFICSTLYIHIHILIYRDINIIRLIVLRTQLVN